MSLSKAYFGGGCFWCIEPVFQKIKGVTLVVSGYSGGKSPNPTYKEICSGLTGHAELLAITYDKSIVSFEELLGVFFSIHNPTTLNRQGNDVGTQYRSVVYCNDEIELKLVNEFIEQQASKIWDNPIVTQVALLDVFYPAEAYHQNYYNNNPQQGYCRVVIEPKVRKFRDQFQHLLT